MNKRCIGLLGLLVCGSSHANAGEDLRQIAETNTANWNSALSHGKLEDILSLYETNAMLVQPNGSVAKNTSEIRAFWHELFEKTAGVVSIDLVDVQGGDKDGTIVTTAKLSDVKTLQNPPQQQIMKYHYDGVLYSVLKRQSDGSWKAQVQQWSDKSKAQPTL